MDTKRDIYGQPVRDLDLLTDAIAIAHTYVHWHSDGYGHDHEYTNTYSHSHEYRDPSHEHPDTAFHAVRPADSDAV